MSRMTSASSMTTEQIAYTCIVVSSMVIGNLLFKASSGHVVAEQGLLRLVQSLLSWQFILALSFYALSTLCWVLLLRQMPLSRAYPFMALSFAILPILSFLVFNEPLTPRYLFGMVLFLSGLFLVATS